MSKYDPQLIGEMVRWWRKMGNPIPEGQPETSQDGEEMAILANRAEAAEAALAAERARAQSEASVLRGNFGVMSERAGDWWQKCVAAEAALAESERAGERLWAKLDEHQFAAGDEIPVCPECHLRLSHTGDCGIRTALDEWRARKGGEAVAKTIEHPYSPPSQEDLRRMRDANSPKMPRQDDRPMKP